MSSSVQWPKYHDMVAGVLAQPRPGAGDQISCCQYTATLRLRNMQEMQMKLE